MCNIWPDKCMKKTHERAAMMPRHRKRAHLKIECQMKIRAGYEIAYDCPQPTPMIVMLSVHPSRTPDLITPDWLRLNPAIAANTYRDGFGNICHVLHAPAGRIILSTD